MPSGEKGFSKKHHGWLQEEVKEEEEEKFDEKIESQKEMGMESKIVHDQKIIGSILSSIHINIVINPHQYSF